MSFAALSSRTLVLVSLVLINDGVNGMHITGLSRRDVPDHDSDGDDDPDNGQSSSGTHSHKTTATSNSLLPSSTNSLASASQSNLAESRHIGTIVGAVLGSVILAGLIWMILTRCRSRARKARKRPRGSIPSTFFADQPQQMSQAQNGPLVVPPAPLTSHPEPIQSLNDSPSNNTRSPLSPRFPPVSPHNLQDTSRSSYQRLSTVDSDHGGSHAPSASLQSHDMQPLQPHDMQRSSSLTIPVPEKAVFAGPASPSTSGQPSTLHRDMAEFQRALEDDHKKAISDQSQLHVINDPPPQYVDSIAH